MVRSLILALLVATAGATAGGCATTRSPELRVLGVHEEPRREVVFVQVTNPANRPIQLTKLEYRFAAGRETISEGELALGRDVPAGEAIVVEVPVGSAPREALTLRGRLTAVTDRIVRIFNVSAEVQPVRGAGASEVSAGASASAK
jgi:LEA14-like dessication related protein